MLLLGIVAERFGHSVITPVINSYNKSFDDSSNYKPINIVPIVSVMELLLIAFMSGLMEMGSSMGKDVYRCS